MWVIPRVTSGHVNDYSGQHPGLQACVAPFPFSLCQLECVQGRKLCPGLAVTGEVSTLSSRKGRLKDQG